MKLYMHPLSTSARPVAMLIAEKRLPVESEIVDLMTGAQYKEPYVSKNPNCRVPFLEDGDFRLTQSSAILKYLADRFDLPEYPKNLPARARVNEAMDWFMSDFYPEWASMIYPQVLPHHARPGEAHQSGTLTWGRDQSSRWLQILNDSWIGPDKAYLCGDQITIADYYAAGIVTLGEVVGCDLRKYPNIDRWIAIVKKLPSYNAVNEHFDGWVASVPEKANLVAVR
jgi:glutathione S-transferase